MFEDWTVDVITAMVLELNCEDRKVDIMVVVV
jgi:hypothetical protein